MKRLIIVLIIFMSHFSYSQSLNKIIEIKEVKIVAKRIFKKEEAGQKTMQVDSIILLDKINANLSDVLSENTTVYIKEHGRGALATASFRGTAATHTQVSWNGMNINSPMLGMVDFSLIPVYIIDDLSLQHGGSSIKEQSGGLGGSISIKNKVDWTNKISGKYYQGIGNYSTYDEFAQFNVGNNKIQSKTRVYNNTSKNDYSFINKVITDKPRVKNKNANYSKYGFAQELYFHPSENNYISAKTWWQNANRSIPTVLSYEGDNQSNLNKQDDNTAKIIIDWKYYNNKSSFYISSGYDYQNLDYKLMNEVSGIGKIPAIYSSSKMNSFYNKLKYDFNINKNILFQSSVNYNHFDVHTKDSVKKTGYDVIRDDFSLFGGIYIQMLKKINLSLMLRDDIINKNFSPLIFDLGLSYKPIFTTDFVIKGSITRNYHHPTLNDLYWQPGGNPDLKPEEGFTEELSIHYINTKRKTNINTQLTAYYSDINKWIIWLPSFKGYWEPFNIKRVKSYGLEYNLKINTEIGNIKLQLHGNYGLTKSLNYGDPLSWGDKSYKKQLPFIPVHSGNVMTSVSYKGFYLRYQYNSYSERFTMTSNKVGLEDDSDDLGTGNSSGKLNWYYPYHMNKVSIGKNLSFNSYKIGLEFKINNLFDEEYRSVLGRYMPGRYYSLLLMLTFDK